MTVVDNFTIIKFNFWPIILISLPTKKKFQAWVLLATYLDVYALPVLMLNFIFGLVTLICVQEQVKV